MLFQYCFHIQKNISVCFVRAGHFERAPFNESDIRSVYHVREYDVFKLMQIKETIDIFVSHDWPRGITDHGNWKKLLRQKSCFKKEVIKACQWHSFSV